MALLQPSPFAPRANQVTVSMAVTVAPAVIQFDNILPGDGINKGRSVRLLNAGSQMVFVKLVGGQGFRTASASTGFPLAPGAERVLNTQGATFVAAVTATGSSTLYATPGEGGI